MFKIAVCDNEPEVITHIRKILSGHIHANEFEIRSFSAGETLCAVLHAGEMFDLIILNIELPGLNGVQVGNFLRETLQDSLTQILYISGKEQYAHDLFDVRPLNFLVKPIKPEKLLACLDQAVELRLDRAPVVTFTANKIDYIVPLREIRYFESYNKQIIVHTIKCNYYYYGKIDKLELHAGFLKIHQSFLVNYRFIRSLSYDSLTLDDGTILSISQPYRKIIRASLFQHFPPP